MLVCEGGGFVPEILGSSETKAGAYWKVCVRKSLGFRFPPYSLSPAGTGGYSRKKLGRQRGFGLRSISTEESMVKGQKSTE